MRFPQIQIRTTDMKIALNIEEPVQIIRQPKATQKIEQPAAIVDIRTTKGKLKIDTTQARRDLGLVGPLESIDKYAKEGKKALLQGISKKVQEGRQLMLNAGKGQEGQIIQQIAKQRTGPKHVPLGIKFIPSVGSVKVEYIPGKTDINVTPQKPKIDVQVNKPIHDYTPGKVSTEVVQYPSIDIDVIK